MPGKRIAVIGSGVVGLFAALYALRRGFDVTLVDREPASRRSCSFGNAGMIVPSHFVPLAAPGAVTQGLRWMLDPVAPFHVRPRASVELLGWLLRFARSATRAHVDRAAPLLRDLSIASRACYEALAAEGADIGLVKQGLLVVCAGDHALREELAVADHARRLGIRAQTYIGTDARSIEPALRPGIAGAVHYPLDCHLVPDRLMRWLESEVARSGARFLWDTEIAHVRRDGQRIVAAETTRGATLQADEYVLCTGAWSQALARDAGIMLPMQAGKGYSVTLSAFPRAPKHCAILAEARVAVTPMDGGVRVGGTMELAGLDRSIAARRARAVVEAVPRYYATIAAEDFDGAAPWSGLRPCTPDGVPYVGRARRCTNLIVASGHAMMGMTLAPVTGTIVAQLLAGESPAFDMPLLSPDRFDAR